MWDLKVLLEKSIPNRGKREHREILLYLGSRKWLRGAELSGKCSWEGESYGRTWRAKLWNTALFLKQWGAMEGLGAEE